MATDPDHLKKPHAATEQVVELCVNLDDVTPEVIGHAQQVLIQAGALDVWTTAIQMKKQRPGVMLCVLGHTADRDMLAERIMRETGSLGVRYRQWDRLVLKRRHATVETPYGRLRIKLGYNDTETLVVQPEFEDAVALAEQASVPVRVVLDAARAAASALEAHS